MENTILIQDKFNKESKVDMRLWIGIAIAVFFLSLLDPLDIIADDIASLIVSAIFFSALFVLIGVVLKKFDAMWRCCEIFVTESNVYGVSKSNVAFNLPYSSIAAVSMISNDGITLNCTSKKYKLKYLSNNKALYDVINKYVMKKYQSSDTNRSVGSSVDTASDLKKYKDLLDSGAITQEEFDAKKKQLLNL